MAIKKSFLSDIVSGLFKKKDPAEELLKKTAKKKAKENASAAKKAVWQNATPAAKTGIVAQNVWKGAKTGAMIGIGGLGAATLGSAAWSAASSGSQIDKKRKEEEAAFQRRQPVAQGTRPGQSSDRVTYESYTEEMARRRKEYEEYGKKFLKGNKEGFSFSYGGYSFKTDEDGTVLGLTPDEIKSMIDIDREEFGNFVASAGTKDERGRNYITTSASRKSTALKDYVDYVMSTSEAQKKEYLDKVNSGRTEDLAGTYVSQFDASIVSDEDRAVWNKLQEAARKLPDDVLDGAVMPDGFSEVSNDLKKMYYILNQAPTLSGLTEPQLNSMKIIFKSYGQLVINNEVIRNANAGLPAIEELQDYILNGNLSQTDRELYTHELKKAVDQHNDAIMSGALAGDPTAGLDYHGNRTIKVVPFVPDARLIPDYRHAAMGPVGADDDPRATFVEKFMNNTFTKGLVGIIDQFATYDVVMSGEHLLAELIRSHDRETGGQMLAGYDDPIAGVALGIAEQFAAELGVDVHTMMNDESMRLEYQNRVHSAMARMMPNSGPEAIQAAAITVAHQGVVRSTSFAERLANGYGPWFSYGDIEHTPITRESASWYMEQLAKEVSFRAADDSALAEYIDIYNKAAEPAGFFTREYWLPVDDDPRVEQMRKDQLWQELRWMLNGAITGASMATTTAPNPYAIATAGLVGSVFGAMRDQEQMLTPSQAASLEKYEMNGVLGRETFAEMQMRLEAEGSANPWIDAASVQVGRLGTNVLSEVQQLIPLSVGGSAATKLFKGKMVKAVPEMVSEAFQLFNNDSALVQQAMNERALALDHIRNIDRPDLERLAEGIGEMGAVDVSTILNLAKRSSLKMSDGDARLLTAITDELRGKVEGIEPAADGMTRSERMDKVFGTDTQTRMIAEAVFADSATRKDGFDPGLLPVEELRVFAGTMAEKLNTGVSSIVRMYSEFPADAKLVKETLGVSPDKTSVFNAVQRLEIALGADFGKLSDEAITSIVRHSMMREMVASTIASAAKGEEITGKHMNILGDYRKLIEGSDAPEELREALDMSEMILEGIRLGDESLVKGAKKELTEARNIVYRYMANPLVNVDEGTLRPFVRVDNVEAPKMDTSGWIRGKYMDYLMPAGDRKNIIKQFAEAPEQMRINAMLLNDEVPLEKIASEIFDEVGPATKGEVTAFRRVSQALQSLGQEMDEKSEAKALKRLRKDIVRLLNTPNGEFMLNKLISNKSVDYMGQAGMERVADDIVNRLSEILEVRRQMSEAAREAAEEAAKAAQAKAEAEAAEVENLPTEDELLAQQAADEAAREAEAEAEGQYRSPLQDLADNVAGVKAELEKQKQKQEPKPKTAPESAQLDIEGQSVSFPSGTDVRLVNLLYPERTGSTYADNGNAKGAAEYIVDNILSRNVTEQTIARDLQAGIGNIADPKLQRKLQARLDSIKKQMAQVKARRRKEYKEQAAQQKRGQRHAVGIPDASDVLNRLDGYKPFGTTEKQAVLPTYGEASEVRVGPESMGAIFDTEVNAAEWDTRRTPSDVVVFKNFNGVYVEIPLGIERGALEVTFPEMFGGAAESFDPEFASGMMSKMYDIGTPPGGSKSLDKSPRTKAYADLMMMARSVEKATGDTSLKNRVIEMMKLDKEVYKVGFGRRMTRQPGRKPFPVFREWSMRVGYNEFPKMYEVDGKLYGASEFDVVPVNPSHYKNTPAVAGKLKSGAKDMVFAPEQNQPRVAAFPGRDIPTEPVKFAHDVSPSNRVNMTGETAAPSSKLAGQIEVGWATVSMPTELSEQLVKRFFFDTVDYEGGHVLTPKRGELAKMIKLGYPNRQHQREVFGKLQYVISQMSHAASTDGEKRIVSSLRNRVRALASGMNIQAGDIIKYNAPAAGDSSLYFAPEAAKLSFVEIDGKPVKYNSAELTANDAQIAEIMFSGIVNKRGIVPPETVARAIISTYGGDGVGMEKAMMALERIRAIVGSAEEEGVGRQISEKFDAVESILRSVDESVSEVVVPIRGFSSAKELIDVAAAQGIVTENVTLNQLAELLEFRRHESTKSTSVVADLVDRAVTKSKAKYATLAIGKSNDQFGPFINPGDKMFGNDFTEDGYKVIYVIEDRAKGGRIGGDPIKVVAELDRILKSGEPAPDIHGFLSNIFGETPSVDGVRMHSPFIDSRVLGRIVETFRRAEDVLIGYENGNQMLALLKRIVSSSEASLPTKAGSGVTPSLIDIKDYMTGGYYSDMVSHNLAKRNEGSVPLRTRLDNQYLTSVKNAAAAEQQLTNVIRQVKGRIDAVFTERDAGKFKIEGKPGEESASVGYKYETGYHLVNDTVDMVKMLGDKEYVISLISDVTSGGSTFRALFGKRGGVFSMQEDSAIKRLAELRKQHTKDGKLDERAFSVASAELVGKLNRYYELVGRFGSGKYEKGAGTLYSRPSIQAIAGYEAHIIDRVMKVDEQEYTEAYGTLRANRRKRPGVNKVTGGTRLPGSKMAMQSLGLENIAASAQDYSISGNAAYVTKERIANAKKLMRQNPAGDTNLDAIYNEFIDIVRFGTTADVEDFFRMFRDAAASADGGVLFNKYGVQYFSSEKLLDKMYGLMHSKMNGTLERDHGDFWYLKVSDMGDTARRIVMEAQPFTSKVQETAVNTVKKSAPSKESAILEAGELVGNRIYKIFDSGLTRDAVFKIFTDEFPGARALADSVTNGFLRDGLLLTQLVMRQALAPGEKGALYNYFINSSKYGNYSQQAVEQYIREIFKLGAKAEMNLDVPEHRMVLLTLKDEIDGIEIDSKIHKMFSEVVGDMLDKAYGISPEVDQALHEFPGNWSEMSAKEIADEVTRLYDTLPEPLSPEKIRGLLAEKNAQDESLARAAEITPLAAMALEAGDDSLSSIDGEIRNVLGAMDQITGDPAKDYEVARRFRSDVDVAELLKKRNEMLYPTDGSPAAPHSTVSMWLDDFKSPRGLLQDIRMLEILKYETDQEVSLLRSKGAMPESAAVDARLEKARENAMLAIYKAKRGSGNFSEAHIGLHGVKMHELHGMTLEDFAHRVAQSGSRAPEHPKNLGGLYEPVYRSQHVNKHAKAYVEAMKHARLSESSSLSDEGAEAAIKLAPALEEAQQIAARYMRDLSESQEFAVRLGKTLSEFQKEYSRMEVVPGRKNKVRVWDELKLIKHFRSVPEGEWGRYGSIKSALDRLDAEIAANPQAKRYPVSADWMPENGGKRIQLAQDRLMREAHATLLKKSRVETPPAVMSSRKNRELTNYIRQQEALTRELRRRYKMILSKSKDPEFGGIKVAYTDINGEQQWTNMRSLMIHIAVSSKYLDEDFYTGLEGARPKMRSLGGGQKVEKPELGGRQRSAEDVLFPTRESDPEVDNEVARIEATIGRHSVDSETSRLIAMAEEFEDGMGDDYWSKYSDEDEAPEYPGVDEDEWYNYGSKDREVTEEEIEEARRALEAERAADLADRVSAIEVAADTVEEKPSALQAMADRFKDDAELLAATADVSAGGATGTDSAKLLGIIERMVRENDGFAHRDTLKRAVLELIGDMENPSFAKVNLAIDGLIARMNNLNDHTIERNIMKGIIDRFSKMMEAQMREGGESTEPLRALVLLKMRRQESESVLASAIEAVRGGSSLSDFMNEMFGVPKSMITESQEEMFSRAANMTSEIGLANRTNLGLFTNHELLLEARVTGMTQLKFKSKARNLAYASPLKDANAIRRLIERGDMTEAEYRTNVRRDVFSIFLEFKYQMATEPNDDIIKTYYQEISHIRDVAIEYHKSLRKDSKRLNLDAKNDFERLFDPESDTIDMLDTLVDIMDSDLRARGHALEEGPMASLNNIFESTRMEAYVDPDGTVHIGEAGQGSLPISKQHLNALMDQFRAMTFDEFQEYISSIRNVSEVLSDEEVARLFVELSRGANRKGATIKMSKLQAAQVIESSMEKASAAIRDVFMSGNQEHIAKMTRDRQVEIITTMFAREAAMMLEKTTFRQLDIDGMFKYFADLVGGKHFTPDEIARMERKYSVITNALISRGMLTEQNGVMDVNLGAFMEETYNRYPDVFADQEPFRDLDRYDNVAVETAEDRISDIADQEWQRGTAENLSIREVYDNIAEAIALDARMNPDSLMHRAFSASAIDATLSGDPETVMVATADYMITLGDALESMMASDLVSEAEAMVSLGDAVLRESLKSYTNEQLSNLLSTIQRLKLRNAAGVDVYSVLDEAYGVELMEVLFDAVGEVTPGNRDITLRMINKNLHRELEHLERLTDIVLDVVRNEGLPDVARNNSPYNVSLFAKDSFVQQLKFGINGAIEGWGMVGGYEDLFEVTPASLFKNQYGEKLFGPENWADIKDSKITISTKPSESLGVMRSLPDGTMDIVIYIGEIAKYSRKLGHGLDETTWCMDRTASVILHELDHLAVYKAGSRLFGTDQRIVRSNPWVMEPGGDKLMPADGYGRIVSGQKIVRVAPRSALEYNASLMESSLIVRAAMVDRSMAMKGAGESWGSGIASLGPGDFVGTADASVEASGLFTGKPFIETPPGYMIGKQSEVLAGYDGFGKPQLKTHEMVHPSDRYYNARDIIPEYSLADSIKTGNPFERMSIEDITRVIYGFAGNAAETARKMDAGESIKFPKGTLSDPRLKAVGAKLAEGAGDIDVSEAGALKRLAAIAEDHGFAQADDPALERLVNINRRVFDLLEGLNESRELNRESVTRYVQRMSDALKVDVASNIEKELALMAVQLRGEYGTAAEALLKRWKSGQSMNDLMGDGPNMTMDLELGQTIKTREEIVHAEAFAIALQRATEDFHVGALGMFKNKTAHNIFRHIQNQMIQYGIFDAAIAFRAASWNPAGSMVDINRAKFGPITAEQMRIGHRRLDSQAKSLAAQIATEQARSTASSGEESRYYIDPMARKALGGNVSESLKSAIHEPDIRGDFRILAHQAMRDSDMVEFKNADEQYVVYDPKTRKHTFRGVDIDQFVHDALPLIKSGGGNVEDRLFDVYFKGLLLRSEMNGVPVLSDKGARMIYEKLMERHGDRGEKKLAGVIRMDNAIFGKDFMDKMAEDPDRASTLAIQLIKEEFAKYMAAHRSNNIAGAARSLVNDEAGAIMSWSYEFFEHVPTTEVNDPQRRAMLLGTEGPREDRGVLGNMARGVNAWAMGGWRGQQFDRRAINVPDLNYRDSSNAKVETGAGKIYASSFAQARQWETPVDALIAQRENIAGVAGRDQFNSTTRPRSIETGPRKPERSMSKMAGEANKALGYMDGGPIGPGDIAVRRDRSFYVAPEDSSIKLDMVAEPMTTPEDLIAAGYTLSHDGRWAPPVEADDIMYETEVPVLRDGEITWETRVIPATSDGNTIIFTADHRVGGDTAVLYEVDPEYAHAAVTLSEGRRHMVLKYQRMLTLFSQFGSTLAKYQSIDNPYSSYAFTTAAVLNGARTVNRDNRISGLRSLGVVTDDKGITTEGVRDITNAGKSRKQPGVVWNPKQRELIFGQTDIGMRSTSMNLEATGGNLFEIGHGIAVERPVYGMANDDWQFMADTLNTASRLYEMNSWDKFYRGVVIPAITRFRITFHWNNKMGNTMNMLRSPFNIWDSYKPSQETAYKLHRGLIQYEDLGPIEREAFDLGVISSQSTFAGTSDETYQTGQHARTSITDKVMGSRGPEVLRAVSATIETGDRLTLYVAARKSGLPPQSAADAVDYYLYDYSVSNLKSFEQALRTGYTRQKGSLKPVSFPINMPFYTFTKRNLGFQISEAVKNPFGAFMHLLLMNRIFYGIGSNRLREEFEDRYERENLQPGFSAETGTGLTTVRWQDPMYESIGVMQNAYGLASGAAGAIGDVLRGAFGSSTISGNLSESGNLERAGRGAFGLVADTAGQLLGPGSSALNKAVSLAGSSYAERDYDTGARNGGRFYDDAKKFGMDMLSPMPFIGGISTALKADAGSGLSNRELGNDFQHGGLADLGLAVAMGATGFPRPKFRTRDAAMRNRQAQAAQDITDSRRAIEGAMSRTPIGYKPVNNDTVRSELGKYKKVVPEAIAELLMAGESNATDPDKIASTEAYGTASRRATNMGRPDLINEPEAVPLLMDDRTKLAVDEAFPRMMADPVASSALMAVLATAAAEMQGDQSLKDYDRDGSGTLSSQEALTAMIDRGTLPGHIATAYDDYTRSTGFAGDYREVMPQQLYDAMKHSLRSKLQVEDQRSYMGRVFRNRKTGEVVKVPAGTMAKSVGVDTNARYGTRALWEYLEVRQ